MFRCASLFSRAFSCKSCTRNEFIFRFNTISNDIHHRITVNTLQIRRTYIGCVSPSSSSSSSSSTARKPGSVPLASTTDCFESPPLFKGITVIDTPDAADYALHEWRRLQSMNKPRLWACDMKVIDLDLKKSSPCVQNSSIISMSIYTGADADFGNGPRLFIDNFPSSSGLLSLFTPLFEDCDTRKVWHNYSLARHILDSHNIHCQGFAGDTSHMARLHRCSRQNGYSLEALTQSLHGFKLRKRSIKEQFGRPKPLSSGRLSNVIVVPELDKLQCGKTTRSEWIDFCVYDAESILMLHKTLCSLLSQMPCSSDTQKNSSLLDFYIEYWIPFAELLSDMEAEGVYVGSNQFMSRLCDVVKRDVKVERDKFIKWATSQCSDAQYMNISSATQRQHLLFAPFDHKSRNKTMPLKREFVTTCKDKAGKYVEKPKSHIPHSFVLTGLGLPPAELSDSGVPSTRSSSLRAICGIDVATKQYGAAYEFFGGGEQGKDACLAIDALLRGDAIEKTLYNFIIPLYKTMDIRNRVHSSFNLDTETGRISHTQPNFASMPSRCDDKYEVRRTVAAEPDHTLMVAQFDDIELRMLAHLSKCKSMLATFTAGEDIHAQTAMILFPNVRHAVEHNQVLFEWNDIDGKAPAPLLKDVFASELSQAKNINFSIASGKTVASLSKELGQYRIETQQNYDLWFSHRPEVKEYHETLKTIVCEQSISRTLLGRYCQITGGVSNNPMYRCTAERKAIKSSIEGSVADIIMTTMLAIHHDTSLRQMKWKLTLPIGNGVMMEGPKHHVDQAITRVHNIMHSMEHKNQLSVPLVSNEKVGDTWYTIE